MQLEATDVLDLSQESEETREMYGLSQEQTQSYGRRCLMARRLVERGVRFVQIFIERQVWTSIRTWCATWAISVVRRISHRCADQGSETPGTARFHAGDLWGRIRPPAAVAGTRQRHASRARPQPERVYHVDGGWGVKGGLAYGATDDIGHKAVENRVSAHDFHATMLHLLGVDFRDLVHDRHGLKERLTGQYPARVITDILT